MYTTSQLAVMKHLLLNEPTSRKQLAKILSLSTAALTVIVNQLIDRGLIYELKEISLGKVGRKETLIDVVEDAYYAIGLYVDIDQVKYSLTTLKGNLEDSRTFETADHAFDYINTLKNTSKKILGLTLMLRGYINESNYYHPDKQLREKVVSLGLPYVFINNVSALAIMHHFYHYEDMNFLMIKYGPGVGSAIMVNGALVDTKSNVRSEIGQMIMDISDNKRLETCIEYDSMGSGIYDHNVVAFLTDKPHQLDYLIQCLAVSIANSNVLLSLDKVIIAGMLFTDDRIFQQLIKKIEQLCPSLNAQNIVRIVDYSEKVRKLGSIVTIYSFLSGLMTEIKNAPQH